MTASDCFRPERVAVVGGLNPTGKKARPLHGAYPTTDFEGFAPLSPGLADIDLIPGLCRILWFGLVTKLTLQGFPQGVCSPLDTRFPISCHTLLLRGKKSDQNFLSGA